MLNELQRQVVESEDKRLLVLAGAGSGKTHTLISKIISMVESGINPTHILSLTFTHVAAIEMATRYADKINSSVEPPTFSTFHGFCYRLLYNKDVRAKLGYKDIPNILEPNMEMDFKTTVLNKLGIKVPLTKLQSSKDMKSDFMLNLFNKCYHKELISKNKITFDILCTQVCKLFIDNDDCIKQYKKQYEYIFADEFQDTDDVQWKFIQSFTDSSIMLVGDPLQNLYSFRGTTSKIIKDLVNNPNWKIIKLDQNYRSTKQICDFANKFSASYADKSYRLELKSETIGADVLNCDCMLNNKITLSGKQIIYNSVQSALKNNANVALLARTNAQVDELKLILDFYNIPYRTKDIAKFDLICNLIKSSKDDVYKYSWLPTKLTKLQYLDYLRTQYCTSGDKSALHNILMHNDNTREYLLAINYLSTLDSAIDILKYFNLPITDTILPDTEFDVLCDYIKSLTSIDELVYVGTIHSAKGLEWDTTIVYGVNTDQFKLTSEDNNNCYYVAVTRARKQLIVLKQ